MSRKSRIDIPGAIHHINVRGITRQKIFKDKTDYNDFLKRFGKIVSETKTACYAWALIPNHFHMLLKTGDTPISTVVQRLLTGYVVSYNRRHLRHGTVVEAVVGEKGS